MIRGSRTTAVSTPAAQQGAWLCHRSWSRSVTADDGSFLDRAKELDAQDLLAHFRDRFLPAEGVIAYLDGSRLGRALLATAEGMASLIRHPWGARLTRGWDDQWIRWPGPSATPSDPGSSVLGPDRAWLRTRAPSCSTSWRGQHCRRGRADQIVLDTELPDRSLCPGRGWRGTRGQASLGQDQPRPGSSRSRSPKVGDQRALVVFSHVAYRPGFAGDVPLDHGARPRWRGSCPVGPVPPPDRSPPTLTSGSSTSPWAAPTSTST